MKCGQGRFLEGLFGNDSYEMREGSLGQRRVLSVVRALLRRAPSWDAGLLESRVDRLAQALARNAAYPRYPEARELCARFPRQPDVLCCADLGALARPDRRWQTEAYWGAAP